MDDIRAAMRALREGTDFCQECKQFTFTKTKEEEDRSSKETDTERTARVMKKVFNSIERDLAFTVETQDEYENNMLPTLDTNLSMVELELMTPTQVTPEGQETGNPGTSMPLQHHKPIKYKHIMYKFFSKPTGSRFTILEPSEGCYQQKKASLSQEVVRRLMNTETDISQEEKVTMLNNFSLKLKDSGYDKQQRREIIEGGVLGYQQRIERQGGD